MEVALSSSTVLLLRGDEDEEHSGPGPLRYIIEGKLKAHLFFFCFFSI